MGVREHNMSMRSLAFLLAFTVTPSVWGQFSYPASASIAIGFAQLTDGGPPDQRWRTTLTFTNPDTAGGYWHLPVNVTVSFYGDDGQPILIDFGSGPVSALNLTVPIGGSKSVTSTGTYSSTQAVVGWALAQSEAPLAGTVLFQASRNGTPFWDVAAVGTGATYFYSSYANVDLGFALANPNTQPINLRIDAKDSNGVSKGSYLVPSLPPHGHKSGNLKNVIDFSGTPDFVGTITITPVDDPPLPFGAWTLNVRNGLLSPLPPGEMVTPGPHNRRTYDIGFAVRNGGDVVVQSQNALLGLSGPNSARGPMANMGFFVDTDSSIKAYCTMVNYGAKLHITTGMIEALGASDAALAFVIAHMAIHGVLSTFASPLIRDGPCNAAPRSGPYVSDPEGLADAGAMAALMQAGFDPAGAADFFAHMVYANEQGLPIDNALKLEFGIPNTVIDRIEAIGQKIALGCSGGGLSQVCETARKYWHPHNPVGTP
jgi:hypothetical protein